MVDPWGILSGIVSGLLIGSVYSLIAMGLALIWGVTYVINFAHGDFMMLGAFLAFYLLSFFGLDPLVGIPLIFIIIFVLGLAVHIGLIERVINGPPINQLFTTFAIMLIIRYAGELIFGPYTRRVVTSYSETVLVWGVFAIPVPNIIALIFSIFIAAFLYWFLKSTYIGIAIRATAQDRAAAQLQGIDIKKTCRIAFGLGVGIAAIGGALLSLIYPIFPEMGGSYSTLSLIVVVLGGPGSIFGAYAGGLIIGVVQVMSALFILPSLKDLVAFLVFIIILLIRPTGLFGK